jgi:Gram-negative porin
MRASFPRTAVCGMGALAGAVVGLCLSARSATGAEIGLNLYGDVDYVVTHQTETTNSFQTPRFEIFSTASEGRLSFLAETMFEAGGNNEFSIDMERVEVAYLFADWFRLHVGRFHTAMGYYNDAYHHGRYFQTTVDRPEMVRFEDEGGLIPAHSVGLHADGRLSLRRAGSLRYDIELANGRGSAPDEVTSLVDHNNAKAFNLRLRYEPAFLDGLIFGVNAYFDDIPAAGADPLMPTITNVGERIYGAHLVYLENDIHFISEFLRIEHRTPGANGNTHAGFVEAGYTFGSFTPYLRYEKVSFPSVLDPFFAQSPLGLRGSFSSILGGVRFLASENIALKAEGGRITPVTGSAINSLAFQCAFAF